MPPRPDSNMNFRRSFFPLWILCLLAMSAAAWAGPPSVQVVNPQPSITPQQPLIPENISSRLTPGVYVISGTAHNADDVQIVITGVGATTAIVAVHGNVWEYAWPIHNNDNGSASIKVTPRAHTVLGTPSATISVNVSNTFPAGGLSVMPSGVTPSVYFAAAVSGGRAATDFFQTGIKLNYLVATAPATHPNITLSAFTSSNATANSSSPAFTFDAGTPQNLNNDAGVNFLPATNALPTSFTLGGTAPGLLPGLNTVSALLYGKTGAADVSQIFNRSVIVDNRAPDVVTPFSVLYPQDSVVAAGVAPPTPQITPPAPQNIRFYGRVQDYEDVGPTPTLPDDVASVEVVVRYGAPNGNTTERIPATLIYGEPVGATSAITTWYADFSTKGKSDGSYSAYAVITDNAGNQTIDTPPDPVTHIATPFAVDNTKPATGAFSAPTPNTVVSGMAVTVTFTVPTDTGAGATGVSKYELRDYTGSDTSDATGIYRVIGNNSNFTIGGASASTSWDTTKVGDGKHTLVVVATDRAGNISDVTSNNLTVYVDNSVPVPTFAVATPSPDPTTIYGLIGYPSGVTISAKVTDSWVDLKNIITIMLKEGAGSTAVTIPLTFKDSANMTLANPPPNGSANGIFVTGTYSLTGVSTGIHTLTLTATNSAGVSASTTQTITVDNTQPVPVSLTVKDFSTAADTFYHISKTVQLTGSYTEDYPKTWEIFYRTHGSGSYTSLGLKGANDRAANTDPTTHIVSTTNTFQIGWNTTTIADGTYDLALQATDQAGNSNTNSLTALATVLVGNNAAQVDIFNKISWGLMTAPATQFSAMASSGQFPGVVVGGGALNPDVTLLVKINFSVDANNLSSWKLEAKSPNATKTLASGVTGGALSTTWDTTTKTGAVSDFPDGNATLVLTVTNMAGTSDVQMANVTVDNTRPEAKIISPVDSSTISTDTLIVGSAVDNSALASVTYTFAQAGATTQTVTVAAPYTTTLPAGFTANAPITVTLTATDVVGNRQSSHSADPVTGKPLNPITLYIGAVSPLSINELDFNEANPLTTANPQQILPETDGFYYLRGGVNVKTTFNIATTALGRWSLDVMKDAAHSTHINGKMAPFALTDLSASSLWNTVATNPLTAADETTPLTLVLTASSSAAPPQAFSSFSLPIKIDNTPPTAAFRTVYSSGGGVPDFARGTTHLQADITEANPKYFQIFVDGAGLAISGNRLTQQTAATPTIRATYLAEYDWNTTTVSEGSHNLTILVTDKAGNQNSAAATTHAVTVANTLPTPQFTKISWGKTLPFPNPATNGQQFSSDAINGQFTNLSISKLFSTMFPGGVMVGNNGVVVGGGINNPDVKNRVALGFSLGSSNVQSWTLTANGITIGGTYPLDTSGLWDTTRQTVPGTPDFPDGPVTLTLTVTDKAGNIRTQTSAVTVDNTRPIPTLSTPANNAFVNKIVAITGNVQEPNLPLYAANGSEFAIYPFTNLNDPVPATPPLPAPQIPGNIVTGTLTAPTLAPVPKPITSIQTPWMPLDLTAPPLVARTPRKFRIQLSPTDVVGNTAATFTDVYVADPAARLTLNTPPVADDESTWLYNNTTSTDYRSKVAYVKGSLTDGIAVGALQGTLMNWANYRLFDSATGAAGASSSGAAATVAAKQNSTFSWNLAEGRHRLRLVAINDNLNSSDDPTNAGNKSLNPILTTADYNNFNSAFASLEVVVDSTKPTVTVSAPLDINNNAFPVAPGSILTLIFTITNTAAKDGSASPLKGVATNQGRPHLTLTIPQVGNPSLFDFDTAVTNPTLTGANGKATMISSADSSGTQVIQVVWQLPIVASTYAYGKTYDILIGGISDIVGNLADTPVRQAGTATKPPLYYHFQVR